MSFRLASRSLAAASRFPAHRAVAPAIRCISSTAASYKADKSKEPISSAPVVMQGKPQFPVYVDPFNPPKPDEPQREYSEGTKNVVKGLARAMGYNSSATTAIRETRNMMKDIVDAVDRDRDFWYNACKLPPTYQSFFQLHLLYVLLMVTRLRAIRTNPDAPVDVEKDGPSMASPLPHLRKPAHESYPTELLSHFFDLAESQMRLVLGRTERERVVRKYMEEMGEQWKGAGTGLDYVLGLGISEDPADQARADSELASWVWRNLFASRGVTPPSPAIEPAVDELEFIEQLEDVVRFVRRELHRLSQISDEDVMANKLGEWGRVEQA